MGMRRGRREGLGRQSVVCEDVKERKGKSETTFIAVAHSGDGSESHGKYSMLISVGSSENLVLVWLWLYIHMCAFICYFMLYCTVEMYRCNKQGLKNRFAMHVVTMLIGVSCSPERPTAKQCSFRFS